jgi:hypothetical protein
MLREVVPMLRQQLEKSMLDRNYVQLERVSVMILRAIARSDCSSKFSNRMQFNNIFIQPNEKYVKWNWQYQQRIVKWNY